MSRSGDHIPANNQQQSTNQNPSASLLYSANSSDRESDLEGSSGDEGIRHEDGLQRTDSLNSTEPRELNEEELLAQLIIKQKNREHAKNTRARRKNYIESLKEDIQQIISTRDHRDAERKDTLNRVAAQIAHRKNVLSTWFAYRTSLETDPVRWLGILDEAFEFVLPITPYRSFPPQEVEDGRRKVVGVDAVIFDTISLHAMAQSAVLPRSSTDVPKVGLSYEVSQESIVAEDTLMCKWRISTENIAARGGLFDVTKQGMLLAVFTSESKLRSLEVSFDVMTFMQQLRRAADRSMFQVVPNVIYVVPPSLAAPPAVAASAAFGEGRRNSHDGGSPPHGPPSPSASSQSSTSRASESFSFSVASSVTGASGSAGTGANSVGSSVAGKSDAFGAFMCAVEPRVVVSATEPYTFLCSNRKYQEVFHPGVRPAADSTVFETLIRSDDSDAQELQEVLNALRNKYPCCAILSCRTGGAAPAVLPHMCTFFPLYGNGGTVEQFLVVLEAITAHENAAAGAFEHAKAAKHNQPGQRHRIDDQLGRGSGSGSQSSHAGTVPSSGSGVTDHESFGSAQEVAELVTRSATNTSTGTETGTGIAAGMNRLTSQALDTRQQQAESDRRDHGHGGVSMQGAATQRWMDDVTASGPAHDFTQRERASGSKMQREDRSSPQEMVSKSSRTGKHDPPVSDSIRNSSVNSCTSDVVSSTLTTSGGGVSSDGAAGPAGVPTSVGGSVGGSGAGSGTGSGNGGDSGGGSGSDSAMQISPAASDSGTPPSEDMLAVDALLTSSPSPPAAAEEQETETADWAKDSMLPPG